MQIGKWKGATLLAAMTMVLAACGGGGGGAGTGDGTQGDGGGSGNGAAGGGSLTIWVDDLRAPAMKEAAAAFKSEAGVDVKVQTVSKDLQTNFVTAAQAGKGPDIVLGAHDWIGNLVQNGTIDPIQMTDDQLAAFDPIAIKGVTFNNQIYGVPFAVENVVLFRNTELVPEAPQTFDDLVATAKRLKAEGKVTELLAIPVNQNGDPYHAYPLFTAAGGYLFGKDENGDYNPQDLGLKKPSAVEAMKKLRQLGEKGDGALKRAITNDNVLSVFTSRKAAFMLSGPWYLAQLKKTNLKYDVSPVPGFKDGEPARPFVGVQALYVASGGKNKAVAQEFATNFFARPDVALALYEADPRPPALLEAIEQVAAKEPIVKKVLDAGKNGDIMPAIPEMATVWDPWGKAEAAVIGGADPAKTNAAAAKAIETAINK